MPTVAPVSPLQSCGIGSALILECERRIRDRGLRRAEIDVENANPRARALYERLGYVAYGSKVSSWDDELADGTVTRIETTCVLLRKDLTDAVHLTSALAEQRSGGWLTVPAPTRKGDVGPMAEHRRRIAAYAICLRDDQVLLTRFVAPDGLDRHWTLPGGGVEHAEDPYHAVVREVEEETGYQVEVEQLLGVDSRSWQVPSQAQGGAELHTVGVYYLVRIVGGELRHEVDGTTDLAAWMAVTDVPSLARAGLVDVGLELERTRPRTGHVDPVPVGGRIR